VNETLPPTPSADPEASSDIPEGIRKARAHLRRDLPALLASRWTRGKWACYSSAGRVAIGRNYQELMNECNRRQLPDGEFVIERIQAGAGSDEEEEIGNFVS
jgi:hypothetical protein